MSFFSNSSGNRRVKRGGSKRSPNLLEVSTRPEKEGLKEIRRRVYWAMRVVMAVAGIGSLVFLGKTGLRRLFWENPVYAVSDLRVSTDGMLTRVQVLELLELEEGRNIFTVDVGRMRATLEALPQVDRAEVRRMLPDRVEIRIVERQPVAWVAATAEAELGVKGEAFLVDGRGYALRTRKMLPEYLSLPIIVGVNMEDIAPGQKLPNAELLAAVELVRLSAGDGRWMPRIVDVSKGYCLMVTDQRKAKVTFGFENLEEQLSRLDQLLETVEPMQRDLQTVNLMLERNIPVTFAPSPAPTNSPSESKMKGKSVSTTKVGSAAAVSSNGVTADQIARARASAAAAAVVNAAANSASTPSVPSSGSIGGAASPTSASTKLDRVASGGAGEGSAKPTSDAPVASVSRDKLAVSKLEQSNLGGVVPESRKERALEKAVGREGLVVSSGSASSAPLRSTASGVTSGSGVQEKDEKVLSVRLSGGEVGSAGAPVDVSAGVGVPVGSPGVKRKAEPNLIGESVPPRAVPVFAKPKSTPAGGSPQQSAPAVHSHSKSESLKPESLKPESLKPESVKPDSSKPEIQAPKSAPLIPNERLRKMFQPHA